MIRLVYPYFNKLGGVERYVVELAQALGRYGHTVGISCSDYDKSLSQGIDVRNIVQIRLGSVLRLLSFVFFELLQKYRPDEIIHTQGANCLRADIVQAQSCHKAWFLESIQTTKTFSWPWFCKLFNPIHYAAILIETYQYNLRPPLAIVAISDVVKKQITTLFKVDPTIVHVVHSGVNCDEFSPPSATQKSEHRRTFGLAPEQIVLTFVGHEFRRKNLETVIRCLGILDDPKYILMVAGKDASAPFESLAKQVGVSSQVRFLGPVNELAALYAASDVFVFPTTHDAFGLVVTEAMASGLAVISGPEAGASELIDHGSDGIVLKDVFDAAALANHIKTLSNEGRRIAMGAKARAKVLDYTWDHVAGRMLELYKDVSQRKQLQANTKKSPTL